MIQFKLDEEGMLVKITTQTRIQKLANTRLGRRAMKRRSWSKFKNAVCEDLGSRLTVVSSEEILFERPRAPANHHLFPHQPLEPNSITAGYFWPYMMKYAMKFVKRCEKCPKPEEPKVTMDSLSQLSTGTGSLMVCRTCGKKGDHWTSRCPYKDIGEPAEAFVDKPAASEASNCGSGKVTYVSPGLRGGPGAEKSSTDMRRRHDGNSVRVSNLSEDIREPDLLELFRPFGAVSRVYVAADQKTGMRRGFGFVYFVDKEDAQRAINKLNEYGYDNLILRVEWATPRATYRKLSYS
ncbi:hypothetical protein UlMin_013358 [Ulmus minor]